MFTILIKLSSKLNSISNSNISKKKISFPLSLNSQVPIAFSQCHANIYMWIEEPEIRVLYSTALGANMLQCSKPAATASSPLAPEQQCVQTCVHVYSVQYAWTSTTACLSHEKIHLCCLLANLRIINPYALITCL